MGWADRAPSVIAVRATGAMDKNTLLKSDFVCLGILMGLCLALGTYLILTTALISTDGVFYISQAQDFARDPLGVAQRHPPGHPALLWLGQEAAGVFAGGDSVIARIHASQAVTLLCRALVLAPLYILGKRLMGSRRSFWAVLLLVALPYPARYGSDVSPQWPYLLFLGLGFCLLYWGLDSGRWWVLGLVGLDAAIGCLIHPLCGQLIVYALLGLTILPHPAKNVGAWKLLGANFLLVAGFAGVLVPYAYLAGAIPQPSRRLAPNSPPVIASIGGKPTGPDVPQFEVRAGELLEVAIEASDPDGDKLAFSAVSVPAESRPVYRFHSAVTGGDFWTISDQEKTWLLAKYPRQTWQYEGIACYACERSGDATGLVPVHRFWSSTGQRHFYTASQEEKRAIEEDSPEGLWTYEGVAFYAFGESGRPAAAVPVCRFWNEKGGYSWAARDVQRDSVTAPEADAAIDAIAWYVYASSQPPAGLSLDGRTLRWQPGLDQKGDYTINVIVDDGELDSCILVKIKVVEAPPAGSVAERPASAHGSAPEPAKMSRSHGRHAYASASMAPRAGGMNTAPGASMTLGAGSGAVGVGESAIALLLVPWCLGLYHRLRQEAGPLERVLMIAVVLVNAGLMLAVHGGMGSGPPARYGFGLVALTIIYVPVGLEVMARQLDRVVAARARRPLPWFHVLAIFSVALCIPGLAKPIPAEEKAYRAASQWLQANTRADEVIAVPDLRISLYAGRKGLLCRQDPIEGLTEYVVGIRRAGAPQVPSALHERYSVDLNNREHTSLVVYSAGQPQ